MTEPLEIPEYLRARAAEARRIEKYKKKQCCVCGKWGADEPFGEPLDNLKHRAGNAFTLKLPASPAVHEKCLRKLKQMVAYLE